MSESAQPTSSFSATLEHQQDPNVEQAPPEAALEEPSYKVYKPSFSSSAAPPPPLPDSYFNPTAADIISAQNQLAARTQALTNAPLELRAAREAREKEKKARYPNTTIRIRFTDRTQLEKTFPSTDKIRSVYAFVRESLREDVKPIKFVLYQPPKRELKVSDPTVKNLSLTDLQLAPSSVLLVRFLDDSLNTSDAPAPLASEILSRAVDLPVPPPPQEAPPTASTSSKLPNVLQSGEKKVPKWFKGFTKK